MIKNIFISYFAIFISYQCWGRDPGDWVGNGASFSENMVSFVYENIDYYLQACNLDVECNGNTKNIFPERPNILTDLIYNDKQEVQHNSKTIRFMPHSALFIIDGSVKIAVTGLHSGDPIYINKDLLVEPDPNYYNKVNTISLQRIVSVLVHELGHHLGIVDHTALDKLGSLVGNISRVESLFIPLNPKLEKFGAQFSFAKSKSKNTFRLALMDHNKYTDLSKSIVTLSHCPQVNSEQLQMESANLWNIYWENPLTVNTKLIAFMILKCSDSSGKIYEWTGDKLIIQPSIKKENNIFQFDSQNLKISIESCNRLSGECDLINTKYNEYIIKNNNDSKNNNNNIFRGE